jgi:hypothetical protein
MGPVGLRSFARQGSRISCAVQGWCMGFWGNVDHAGRKVLWNADQRGLCVETTKYKEGVIEIRIASSKVWVHP